MIGYEKIFSRYFDGDIYYLCDLDEFVEHGGSLLQLIGSYDLGGDPVAHSVEALDHLDNVGGGELLVLLSPRLVEELPGFDGFVEVVFEQGQLTRNLLGMEIQQPQLGARTPFLDVGEEGLGRGF